MKPLYKIPLKYGLSGAVLAILVIVILFYAGRHPLLISPMLDFRIILFALFIFFGLREFRDYYNNNILNFWQGMVISFIIYVTIGIIAGLFIIIFAEVVPEFLQDYIKGAVQGLENDKSQLVAEGDIRITEEEYNRQIQLLKNMKPTLLAVDYVLKSCFIGFFIAIILSVILRRTEKRF